MESLDSLLSVSDSETIRKESSEASSTVCPTHGIQLSQQPSLAIAGGIYQPGYGCHKCEQEMERERQFDAERRRASAFRQAQTKAEIPPRYRDARIGSFPSPESCQIQMLKIIDQFIAHSGKGGTGLIILGNVGTGKTHLACAVLNAFLSQGKSGLIQTTLQTVRRIKESWGKDTDRTEKSALNSLFAPDLFVLDEVGVQRGSDSETLILNEIIDGRYGRTKPTILVSNLTMPELTFLLGERSIDRFREGGAVLTLDGQSQRPKESPWKCLSVAAPMPTDNHSDKSDVSGISPQMVRPDE